MTKTTIWTLMLTMALASTAMATPTPEQKCQAAKNLAAGKYAACRQNAEKGLALSGDGVKYGDAIAKCESKFAGAWQKAIDKASDAAAVCLDAPLTGPQFKAVIDAHTDDIATALAGGGLTP